MLRVWLVAILGVACSKADEPAPPPERAEKVNCAPLAEAAKADWTAAATSMAKLGAACSPHVEPVVAAMVAAMDANQYTAPQFEATRQLLDHVPLSADQNQRVMDATARLEKVATGPAVEEVQNQARKCIKNRQPLDRPADLK